jgi:hypothetical protein
MSPPESRAKENHFCAAPRPEREHSEFAYRSTLRVIFIIFPSLVEKIKFKFNATERIIE